MIEHYATIFMMGAVLYVVVMAAILLTIVVVEAIKDLYL